MSGAVYAIMHFDGQVAFYSIGEVLANGYRNEGTYPAFRAKDALGSKSLCGYAL